MKDSTFSDSSELKMFSLGIVVENTNGTIKVSPIEGMNVQPQGKIYTAGKNNTLKGNHPSDSGGNSSATEVAYTNHVTAEWLALGTPNRVSPPTVYPNETVMLYKYGNVDKYYWTTMKHEPDLRKVESATYAWSNIKDGWVTNTQPEVMSGKNSYFLSIGDGGISISTPKNASEPAAYMIVIDCNMGTLTIKDDLSNSVILDSVKGTLSITTKSDINLKSDGAINLKSAKRVTVDAAEVAVTGDLYVAGTLNSVGIAHAADFKKGGVAAPSTATPPAATATATSKSNPMSTPAQIAAAQIAVFGKVMSPDIEALLANPATANATYVATAASTVNAATTAISSVAYAADPRNFSLGNVANAVTNSATNAVNSVVNSASNAVNNVVNSATNAVNNAVNNAVTATTNAVNNAVNTAVNNAVGAVNNAVNNAVSKVNNVVNTVNNTVNTAVNTVNNTVNVVNNTVNAVTNTTNAVITSATAVNTSLTNALDRSLNRS